MPTDRPTLAGRDCRTWIGAAVHVFQTDLFTAAIFVQTQRAVLKSAARCESSHEVMKSPVSGHDRARVRIDWCVLLALLIAASGHAEQAWRVRLGAAHHGRAGLPTAGAGSCSQPFGKPEGASEPWNESVRLAGRSLGIPELTRCHAVVGQSPDP